ncbi:MAG: hypothetical protein ACRDRX_12690 [Pseudonocardiaceae bacterium]
MSPSRVQRALAQHDQSRPSGPAAMWREEYVRRQRSTASRLVAHVVALVGGQEAATNFARFAGLVEAGSSPIVMRPPLLVVFWSHLPTVRPERHGREGD